MCDYSLSSVKTRNAVVGDKLRTSNFGTGTRGFAPVDDPKTAVCLLPGTEIAFDEPIQLYGHRDHCEVKTAIFRQINKDNRFTHHDAIELPSGGQILLTFLHEGQIAMVLQLPAAPKTKAEAEEQKRLETVA